MSLLRPRVRDHRGKRVPMRIRWFEAFRLDRGHDDWLWIATGLLLPLVLAIIVLVIVPDRERIPEAIARRTPAQLRTGIGPLVVLVALTIATVALTFVPGFVLTRLLFWPRTGLRWMCKSRQCPSCSYGLADLAPEPDGCTVCPECGAAWRLPADRQEGGSP